MRRYFHHSWLRFSFWMRLHACHLCMNMDSSNGLGGLACVPSSYYYLETDVYCVLKFFLCLCIQLTLEWRGFELCGSTYTWMFFSSWHYITTWYMVGWIHDAKELWIWRPHYDYKLQVDSTPLLFTTVYTNITRKIFFLLWAKNLRNPELKYY